LSPPPRGNGFWSQEIYYHVLNCGLPIPPSAGSTSGVLPNPLGYNRVYVHLGQSLEYHRWWEGLKAGHVFVTNGPLLLVTANGQLPGTVLAAEAGGQVRVQLEAELISLDRVPQVEIVKNGRVVRSVPWDNRTSRMDLGRLTFNQSGWFLVRAITDLEHTFRFASTGPFYVEVGKTRRVSRQSARFFPDGVNQRIARVPVKLEEPRQLREVLACQEEAEAFWKKDAGPGQRRMTRWTAPWAAEDATHRAARRRAARVVQASGVCASSLLPERERALARSVPRAAWRDLFSSSRAPIGPLSWDKLGRRLTITQKGRPCECF